MNGRNLSISAILRPISCVVFVIPALVASFIAPAMSAELCQPVLAISDAHFTEMQPPTLSRTWSAVVSVDAPHCAANAKGQFDIVFVREKETEPDLAFRERFVWRAPAITIKVDFAADEAVQSYRIDNVTTCMCGN
jgi:hypothetical protein